MLSDLFGKPVVTHFDQPLGTSECEAVRLKVLDDETLRAIGQELVKTLRANATID